VHGRRSGRAAFPKVRPGALSERAGFPGRYPAAPPGGATRTGSSSATVRTVRQFLPVLVVARAASK